MKFELHLSHWLRAAAAIYAALSFAALTAGLSFPALGGFFLQSWVIMTNVLHFFIIILLLVLLYKLSQLNRIRSEWRNEKRRENKL